MSRYSKLWIGLLAGFIGAGGCNSRSGDNAPKEEVAVVAVQALESAGITADLTVSDTWPTGYIARIKVKNTGSTTTSKWQVTVQLNDSTLDLSGSTPWNATYAQSGALVTFTGTSNLLPDGEIEVGFQGAKGASTNYVPVVIAVCRDSACETVGSGGSTGSGGSSAISTGGAGGTGGSGGTGGTTDGGSVASGNSSSSGGATNAGIALGKNASASSELSGSPPSYGNDDSLTTLWCASSAALNEWWTVDLGAAYDLTSAEITWQYAGRTYDYVLSTSFDNVSFVDVVDQRENERTSQKQSDVFTAQGRYVRVTITGLTESPTTSACFYDLKLFGNAASTNGSGGSSSISGSNATGGVVSDQTTLQSGGTFSTGGATSTPTGGTTTNDNGSSSASSGGTISSGSTSSGGTSVDVDRRVFTIRLPGGVSRQDVAVGTSGGPVFINDRVTVLNTDGSYASVTASQSTIKSRIGVSAHVQNAWIEGNLILTNGTTLHGVAKSTGTVAKEFNTSVAGGIFEQFKFTTPEVIAWNVDFPWSPSVSYWLQPSNVATVPPGSYNGATVPREAHLRLSAGTYTFNRIAVEDGGVLEIDNSAGPVLIYMRDAFFFRGKLTRAVEKANVLFGIAGQSTVFIERAFKGIVVAPWAEVSATTADEYRGSFFGKSVTIHQESRFVHEPFEPDLFCASDAECSDFCPCGGNTCGESSCPADEVCGENLGRRYGRASGISVCMPLSCSAGNVDCGSYKDKCGTCNGTALECSSNSDCLTGDVCGSSNGGRFGRFPTLNVCWSAICQTAPNTPPNCGTAESSCGACDCQSACAFKVCGDDPSDGCGGTCSGICQNGQGGCNQDGDCPSGSVCGYQIGARFGLAANVNVCWPSSCRMQDPSKPNGGVNEESCGLSPECVPQCTNGSTGPNGCGGYCGPCKAGDIRTSFGYCSKLVSDIWQSPWDPTVTSSRNWFGNPTAYTTPSISPPSSTSEVGATAGVFNVSDTGEASFEIPIAVPPGRANLQPQLNLSYKSNKINGTLGLGWALRGTSSISICAPNFERDGYADEVDFVEHFQLCLDGVVLRSVSTTDDEVKTYHPEGDPSTKITEVLRNVGSSSVPDYFVLQTKEGETRTFGGKGATVYVSSGIGRVWALSKITDRSGNAMNFYYHPQTIVGDELKQVESVSTRADAIGDLVLDAISYGNNEVAAPGDSPSRWVKFNYENRPDPILHYTWGAAGYSNTRLNSISTYVSDTPVRTYKVKYATGPGGVSLIESITECSSLGYEDESGVCKPPTTFEYENESGWSLWSDHLFSQPVKKHEKRYVEYKTLVLDVDGDGRDDIFKYATSGEPDCKLWVSRIGTKKPSILITAGSDSSVCMLFSAGAFRASGAQVIDLNHDGEDDILAPSGHILKASGNVTGDLDSAFLAPLPQWSWNSNPKESNTNKRNNGGFLVLFDHDGDGLKDIADCPAQVTLTSADGHKFTPEPVFYRALGPYERNTDSIHLDEFGDFEFEFPDPGYVCGKGPTYGVHYGIDTNGDLIDEVKITGWRPVDFNGDGQPEFVVAPNFWQKDKKTLLVTGRFYNGAFDYNSFQSDFVAVDSDGDRRQELLFATSSVKWNGPAKGLSFDTLLSPPFFQLQDVHADDPPIYGRVQVGDFNGDGTPDLLNTGDPPDPQYWGSPAIWATDVRVNLGKNTAKAGLLRQVTDGLGKRINIEYDQYGGGTDATESESYPVYSADDCFSKSKLCLKKVGPVVSSHTETQVFSNLVSPGPTYQYRYFGARRGPSGRTWFTFTKRSITGSEFSQEIEFYTDRNIGEKGGLSDAARRLIAGKKKSVKTTTVSKQPSSAFSKSIGNRTQLVTNGFSENASSNVLNVYMSSRSTVTSEGDALIANSTWKANAIDAFGFITDEEMSVSGTSEVSKTVIKRTIANDSSMWRLGLVANESVASTIAGKTETREVGFEYDDKARLASIHRQPNGAAEERLTTAYIRDTYGNVQSITQTNPLAPKDTRVVYSVSKWSTDHFWPETFTNALGHSHGAMSVAATGQVTETIDANGAVGRFRYDAFGRLSFADTPQGIARNDYLATSPGQDVLPVWGAILVKTTQQGAGYSSTTYDAFGRVVMKESSGFDAIVGQEFEYDNIGRLVRESRLHKVSLTGSAQGEGIVNYTYNGPFLASIDLPDGNSSQYIRLNRSSAKGDAASWFNDPNAIYGTVEVHPRGNISATITNPAGLVLLRATGSGSSNDTSTVAYTYGAFGVPSTVTGPGGTTTIVNDALGRPKSVTESSTGTTTTQYNAFGEAIQLTDGNGVTTTIDHDALGRPTEIRDSADAVISKWIYDGTKANEKGRLVAAYRQSAPGATTGNWLQYHYQNEPYSSTSRGMLESITYGIGGTLDAIGSGEQYTIGYKYEDSGAPWRATGVTYPAAAQQDFGIGLQYSASGALSAITSSDSSAKYWELVSADQGMRPAVEQFGNGVRTTYSYYHLNGTTNTLECDGQGGVASCMPGLLKSIRTESTSSTETTQHLSQSYTYDGNYNVRTKTDTTQPGSRTHTYSYDAQDRLTADQLTSVGSTDTVTDSFSYDAAGNLTSKTGVDQYSYNPLKPFHLDVAGGVTHVWDNAGNILSRSGDAAVVPGGKQVFNYDSLNLPFKVTKGDGAGQATTEFEYNASGQRVVKRNSTNSGVGMQVTATTVDIGELYQLVRKYDASVGTLPTSTEHHYRVFVRGRQVMEIVKPEAAGAIIDSEVVTRYLHHDHLGSSIVATTSDGTSGSVNAQEFDAFGAKKASSTWDYGLMNSGFTGHQQDDDLGLVNMRGRLYDARLGRFMKADPFVFNPMSAAGLNRYSYVENNPINLVDPTGYVWWNPLTWFSSETASSSSSGGGDSSTVGSGANAGVGESYTSEPSFDTGTGVGRTPVHRDEPPAPVAQPTLPRESSLTLAPPGQVGDDKGASRSGDGSGSRGEVYESSSVERTVGLLRGLTNGSPRQQTLMQNRQFYVYATTGTVITGAVAVGTAIGGGAILASATEAFSAAELAIVNEVRAISLAQLRAAFQAGGAELNIAGRMIIVEPGMPASGMTLFGENGFVLGREAFASNSELTKTLLHELFRLSTSQSAAGASGALVTTETNAAFSFAARAFGAFF